MRATTKRELLMEHRGRITFNLLLFLLLGFSLAIIPGCNQEQSTLVVYAGKGLKKSIEEIRQSFENRYKIPVAVIYAGSNTLLTTIQKTKAALKITMD